MGNHFGENLPKVQEFPTSVGCFHEIATKVRQKYFLIYMRTCYQKSIRFHFAGRKSFVTQPISKFYGLEGIANNSRFCIFLLTGWFRS